MLAFATDLALPERNFGLGQLDDRTFTIRQALQLHAELAAHLLGTLSGREALATARADGGGTRSVGIEVVRVVEVV